MNCSTFDDDICYTFRDGSNIKVYSMCFQSYPCKHEVEIDNKEAGLWCAKTIIKYFQDREGSIPSHFSYLLPKPIASKARRKRKVR